jgi:hypothetical protein
MVNVIILFAGVLSDILTTRRFIKDIGIKYEWNELIKYLYTKYPKKWFRIWVIIEGFVIAILILISLFLPKMLLFGVFWGVFRGLLGIDNLRNICDKYSKLLSQKPPHEVWKTKLQFKICFVICLVGALLILFAPFWSFQVDAFWHFLFVSCVIFGVAFFLLVKVIVN